MMKINQDANHIFPGSGAEWVGHFLRFYKDEISKVHVSIGQHLCKNSRVNKAFSYNQINNESNHWQLDTF